jgi:hypothetical protein
MSGKAFRIWWIVGNLAWLILIPIAFGAWLGSEVEAQYRTGARIASGGDSIAIPIAFAVALNTAFVLVVNLVAAAFFLVRRCLRGRSNGRR